MTPTKKRWILYQRLRAIRAVVSFPRRKGERFPRWGASETRKGNLPSRSSDLLKIFRRWFANKVMFDLNQTKQRQESGVDEHLW